MNRPAINYELEMDSDDELSVFGSSASDSIKDVTHIIIHIP